MQTILPFLTFTCIVFLDDKSFYIQLGLAVCWDYHVNFTETGDIDLALVRSSLKWLDRVFQGQYLPSLSIDYVAINKDLEKLSAQLY